MTVSGRTSKRSRRQSRWRRRARSQKELVPALEAGSALRTKSDLELLAEQKILEEEMTAAAKSPRPLNNPYHGGLNRTDVSQTLLMAYHAILVTPAVGSINFGQGSSPHPGSVRRAKRGARVEHPDRVFQSDRRSTRVFDVVRPEIPVRDWRDARLVAVKN